MDLSVKVAQNALANPPPELRDILSAKDLPNGAHAALVEAGLQVPNGSSTSNSPTPTSTTTSYNSSSSSPPANPQVQIINEAKEFTPHLNTYIRNWGLADVGFGYNVVAVFGSQSTGKSTLLNRLFATTFDVMNETERRQTTKGIWMCRAAPVKDNNPLATELANGNGAKPANILVMDVEGTDGRERGEDQDFERKSALFSLASSEVLIVNIWEHQVGLYQGANMGLLKTVFEVNLGLFGTRVKNGYVSLASIICNIWVDKTDAFLYHLLSSVQKTLLFFVIRDHVGSTPLINLAKTLEADLTRIWESLSKPEGLEDRKITDYFDLSFTGLAHKILMPDKFESDVVDLRKRFVDPSRPDYVFQSVYHKRIPADGVSHYMETIWVSNTS